MPLVSSTNGGFTVGSALATTFAMISVPVGISCLIAALFSFNNYFHEQRGNNTSAVIPFLYV